MKTTQVCLYPFQRKHGELVHVLVQSVATRYCFTIFDQMVPLPWTHSCYREWQNSRYLVYFFLNYPLDLRISEWTARGYVMYSWGYGVILIFRYWICRLAPIFSGRWENCLKFCQICDGALIWCVVITKWLNMWKWEIFFRKRDDCPTFWWKMCRSPFTHFWGSVADWWFKFQLRASLALLLFVRWHCRYGVDWAPLWRMMQ